MVVVKLCEARASVGELSMCYRLEGLMLDSLCDTSDVQVTVVVLQLPSKVAERAWFPTHVFSSKLHSSQTHRRS